MSSKARKQRPQRDSAYDTKPDFAMDAFPARRPQPVKPQAEAPEALRVRDRLAAGALAQLETLRAQMATSAPADERTAAVPKVQKPTPQPAQARRASDEADDSVAARSFAELFDPQPDDEADFDTLLHDSKLDWREYK